MGKYCSMKERKNERKREENNRCGVQHAGLRLQLMDEGKRGHQGQKVQFSLPLLNEWVDRWNREGGKNTIKMRRNKGKKSFC